MAEPRRTWWLAAADFPIIGMAVGICILLYRTIAPRLAYPYDLEWMEGGMLLHGQRVAEGLPLYVEPSLDFIPFIYTPLYPWILGALGQVTALDYSIGRTVSVLGIAAAAAALVVALRRERGTWAEGLAAAALFLSCYPDSGAFFDLVRNDGLLMGLIAWSLVLIRREHLRVGGLLLVAAFATKHTAALFGLPALIWLWRTQGRARAIQFALWSVVPALALTIGLTVHSGGRFLTYVLGVPSVHPFVFRRFIQIGPQELATAMPWMVVFAVVAVGLWWPRRREMDGYWLGQGLLALLLALIMRGHHGGYMNVLIPGFWVLSLWTALAMGSIRRRWPQLAVRLAMGGLVAFQLWDARWQPNRFTPTAADRAAGDAIVAQLQVLDGPILAPWNPYLPVQAGHEGSVALIALWDIDYKRGPLYDEAQVIATGIENRHWAAILTSKAKLGRGLRQHYKRAQFSAPHGRAFYPKTGWRVRPHQLWVPKEL
jgi:hypothetical protein